MSAPQPVELELTSRVKSLFVEAFSYVSGLLDQHGQDKLQLVFAEAERRSGDLLSRSNEQLSGEQFATEIGNIFAGEHEQILELLGSRSRETDRVHDAALCEIVAAALLAAAHAVFFSLFSGRDSHRVWVEMVEIRLSAITQSWLRCRSVCSSEAINDPTQSAVDRGNAAVPESEATVRGAMGGHPRQECPDAVEQSKGQPADFDNISMSVNEYRNRHECRLMDILREARVKYSEYKKLCRRPGYGKAPRDRIRKVVQSGRPPKPNMNFSPY